MKIHRLFLASKSSDKIFGLLLSFLLLFIISHPAQAGEEVDVLISGGTVYQGGEGDPIELQVAIKNGRIYSIGKDLDQKLKARSVIDAKGMIVAPGFIDPHTHADAELNSNDKNANLNYLTQGVTTVFIGNDGGGTVDVKATFDQYRKKGIGTNVATYIGHGALRRSVMGIEDRAPTADELRQMKEKIAQAMDDGALGLSTGLYYVPGSYAKLDEVVALAKIAAEYEGVYDSHIRDESSYSIGLKGAVDEVIEIARQTGIAVHIAHIKALGVDVWGQSRDVVAMIEGARAQGLKVTADQYPWRASGTSLEGALMPRWVMAGSKAIYRERLLDPELQDRIRSEMTENLRRRGGTEAILITDKRRPELVNKTLAEVAEESGKTPVNAALEIIMTGNASIASFNMSPDDIRFFMQQPWVMTSSDGSSGHPRKYASYPKKYADYVVGEGVMSLGDFIYKSSGQVADIFGLKDRGYIKPGYIADIIIFDPHMYRPKADFANPEELTEGINWVLLKGHIVIEKGKYLGHLKGQTILRGQ